MVAPLKPTEIQQALQRGTQQELDEFQRLVAEQFETDPLLVTPQAGARLKERTDRLRDLGKKLFG